MLGSLGSRLCPVKPLNKNISAKLNLFTKKYLAFWNIWQIIKLQWEISKEFYEVFWNELKYYFSNSFLPWVFYIKWKGVRRLLEKRSKAKRFFKNWILSLNMQLSFFFLRILATNLKPVVLPSITAL